MSPPQLSPESPLGTRDDALGALLRTANHELAQHIDREASLRRLEQRLNQPAPRKLGLVPLALGPALLVLVLFAWPALSPHKAPAPVATSETAATSVPLEVEASLAQGSTALPDGSSVRITGESHAKWRRTARGIRVRLAAGQVHCRVTKQRRGERFVVEAGEYSFVVLGTLRL